jgi:hypothetical protein
VPEDPGAPAPPPEADVSWRAPGGFPWPPVVLIGVAVLISAVVIGWRVTRPAPAGPKVITDQAFVQQANARCSAAIPGLRPQDTRRDDISSPAQIAEQSTRAAEGLALLAQELRSLPVVAEQKPFVDGWLDGWGTFIDSGRRYARAIESGDVEAANEVARSGDPAQRQADAFARGNGIDSCLLQSAIRKPKGSGI